MRVPRLAAASFGITLLAKVFATGLQRIHDHGSAFDDAVKLLIHYPESIAGIVAFFAVVLMLLCFTLLIEPSYLGLKIRQWIIIPSLHTAEHMVSLALGVFVAWAVMDTVEIGVPYGSYVKTGAALLFASILLSIVAVACAVAAELLHKDYDRLLLKLGASRYLVLILASGFLFASLYVDFVWKYSPSTTAHGQADHKATP